MSQYSRLRRQSYNHPHLRQFSPYRRSHVGAGAEAEPEAVTYTVENDDKTPESKEPAVAPSSSGWTIWSVVLISSLLVVVLAGIYFALAYWVFSDLWPFNTSSSVSSHKSSSTGSNLGIGPPSEGSSSSSSQFDFSSSPSISSSPGVASSAVQTISSSLSYSSSPPPSPISSSIQISSSAGRSSSLPSIPSSSSSSSSSSPNQTVHAFLIYGQSNAQGFGANQSPIPTVNNTFQYSITDGFSDYFEFNPPNNWNNHSGQILPFTMEPLEDSQSPLYSSSICGGDNGGSLIGFTASFSKQYQINNPGVSVLLLNCAIGGAGYGSGDPAGNIGLMTSAYWGVGSPLSNRCISAAQNITRLWSNVTFKGAIVIHGETDASTSMSGSTYQTYSVAQWNTFIANIPTLSNSTPIIFVSMVPGWLRTSVGTAQQIQATINNFPSVIPYSCSIQGVDLAPGDCGLIHYSGPAQVLNGVNIANAFKSCLPNNPNVRVVLIGGQSNGVGEGEYYNPILDTFNGTNVYQFIIGDQCSAWNVLHTSICPTNTVLAPQYSLFPQAGQVVPYATEPLIDANPSTGTYSNLIGFGMKWIQLWAANNPGLSLIVIQAAISSSSFSSGYWPVGDIAYNRAVAAQHQVMALYPSATFLGILWSQGESDVGISTTTYLNYIIPTFQGFRSSLTNASSNLPIAILSLGQYWVAQTGSSATQIQTALQLIPTYLSHTTFVFGGGSATDSSSSDILYGNIHYNAVGQRINGFNLYYGFLNATQYILSASSSSSSGTTMMTSSSSTSSTQINPFDSLLISDYQILSPANKFINSIESTWTLIQTDGIISVPLSGSNYIWQFITPGVFLTTNISTSSSSLIIPSAYTYSILFSYQSIYTSFSLGGVLLMTVNYVNPTIQVSLLSASGVPTLYCYISDGPHNCFTTSTSITTNTTYFVSCAYDGSSCIRMYLNGIAVGTPSCSCGVVTPPNILSPNVQNISISLPYNIGDSWIGNLSLAQISKTDLSSQIMSYYLHAIQNNPM